MKLYKFLNSRLFIFFCFCFVSTLSFAQFNQLSSEKDLTYKAGLEDVYYEDHKEGLEDVYRKIVHKDIPIPKFLELEPELIAVAVGFYEDTEFDEPTRFHGHTEFDEFNTIVIPNNRIQTYRIINRRTTNNTWKVIKGEVLSYGRNKVTVKWNALGTGSVIWAPFMEPGWPPGDNVTLQVNITTALTGREAMFSYDDSGNQKSVKID